MSISYKAAIVVGAEWKNVTKINQVVLYEKVVSLIEQEEFDDFPPYYDGDKTGVFGYNVESTERYQQSELDFVEIDKHISYLKQEFERLTSMQAKVYLTPIVY